MSYKHTQTGYLMIIVALVVLMAVGQIATKTGFDSSILATIFLVLLVLGSFISLTVAIDKTHLKIKFGYGIFRKSFALSDIVSANSVKNSWYHGWGMHFWFWPPMRIYNVSGFSAVEIKMKNGKIYRIGTDEPKKLEEALTQIIM